MGSICAACQALLDTLGHCSWEALLAGWRIAWGGLVIARPTRESKHLLLGFLVVITLYTVADSPTQNISPAMGRRARAPIGRRVLGWTKPLHYLFVSVVPAATTGREMRQPAKH